MAYQLVIFDLGGVVVEVESDRLVHHVAQLLGRSFDDVQAAVYHPELLLPFELGAIAAPRYYAGLNRTLNLGWTYEQFVRAWNDIFQEHTDVTGLIGRLAKHYRLTALSNTNELHLAHIKRTVAALSVLDDWVASCDVGLRKPDPQIYRLALERAGVAPEQAVYIDDRPELVEAGRSVGLMAIRFHSGRKLEADLQALGLDF